MISSRFFLYLAQYIYHKKYWILGLLPITLFAQSPEFEARGILYLQDADLNAHSESTRKIERSGIDMAGIFTFPLDYVTSQHPSEQNISTSALSNHRLIAMRSDKRLVYIAETKGSLPKNIRESVIDSLPQGEFISVLRTDNLQRLRPEYRFQVPSNPTAIALDPSDKYLAVSSSTPGNEVTIYELDDFGKPIRLLPSVIHLDEGAVNDIFWLPDSQHLVYIKGVDKKMGLIKVVKDRNTIIRLEQFGEEIKFEGNPICGMASSDGQGIYLLDSGNKENHIRGKVFYIKLSFEEDKKHILLNSAEVGFNPSQMTMHPSGENIVVTNLGNGNLSEASLSVLYHHQEVFEEKTTISISGLLPGAIKFDRRGRNFVLSIFQTKAFGKPVGSIHFYKFTTGSQPKVEKQAATINMPVGIHYLQVFN